MHATTQSRAVENACGLPMVLRVAQAADLPNPDRIVVDNAGVCLFFPDRPELDAWARYFDAPVNESMASPSAALPVVIAGANVFDLEVQLLHIVRGVRS